MITSRHNPHIKTAAKLRNRRQRDRQRRFLIDGVREIERAVQAGVPIHAIFRCADGVRDSHADELVAALANRGVLVFDVAPTVFEKISFGDRTSGIVAEAAMLTRHLCDLNVPPDATVAVLESVEKPGNLGAIARSADGAGVAALITTGSGTDRYNPNAIRASLGTIFTVPIVAADSRDALAWAKTRAVPTYATRPDAAHCYREVDFIRGCTLVLGSEAEGLSDVWNDRDVVPICLPMRGIGDSLNVSATAAVLFYEAFGATKRGVH